MNIVDRVVHRVHVLVLLLQQSELPECASMCDTVGGCRCFGEKGDRVCFSTGTGSITLVRVGSGHRRNFVCDDGNLSQPLVQSGICNFCIFSHKNTTFSLYSGQENRIFLDTRSVLWPKICRKCDSGLGSARTPLGELSTL